MGKALDQLCIGMDLGNVPIDLFGHLGLFLGSCGDLGVLLANRIYGITDFFETIAGLLDALHARVGDQQATLYLLRQLHGLRLILQVFTELEDAVSGFANMLLAVVYITVVLISAQRGGAARARDFIGDSDHFVEGCAHQFHGCELAAWYMLLATTLLSAAAVCRSDDALPMRCINCAIMLRK